MKIKRVVTVDDERLQVRYAKGLVSVIDDDVGVLNALKDLIEYEGYACETYAGVQAFLDAQSEVRFPGPCCILSDMCMPELDGLALQERLPRQSHQVIVFMSGMSDVSQVSAAFRQGALHFLTKPVRDEVLFDILAEAMAQSQRRQHELSWRAHQADLAAKLTAREREVAKLTRQGLPIKSIAAQLGVSDRAVKLYRQQLTTKLELQSMFELVKLVDEGLIQ